MDQLRYDFVTLLQKMAWATALASTIFCMLGMVVSKTKHPKLENGAPKTRKRSTQITKMKHPKIENEALKTQNLCVL